MSELTERKCVPCEGGIPALTRAEAEALMPQLAPDWKLAPDASCIERAYSFKDFFRAMSFVNAVAHVANVEDHHPDLEVNYGRCRVRWNTHAVKGLSENDFICAAKLDRIEP